MKTNFIGMKCEPNKIDSLNSSLLLTKSQENVSNHICGDLNRKKRWQLTTRHTNTNLNKNAILTAVQIDAAHKGVK